MENKNMVGRRLSFSQLLADAHVLLPIIQRDYAQGRKGESEVRNTFLDKLFDYLSGDELEKDLDFVYGNTIIENGISRFIPLDGQQRLTTLMLLHWYLSLRADMFREFAEMALHRNLEDGYVVSKFSYQTRSASRSFCNALFQMEVDLSRLLPADPNKGNALSKTIANAYWFSLSWIDDPTVKAMMNMLDAIHERFFNGSENFYARLVNQNERVITFLFLDLNEHNLSDDLYIKMNARGVTLSPFENFKANFEQFLARIEPKEYVHVLTLGTEERKVNLKNYYAHQIDTEWSNIFWTFSKHNPDSYDLYLTNLIRTMAIAVYASAGKGINGFKHDKIIEPLLSRSSSLSFYSYNKLGLFREADENPLHAIDKRMVNELIGFLDILKLRPTGESYFSRDFYFDENSILKTLFSTSYKVAEYGARIKFYAYYKYLITYGNQSGFEDFKGLAQWLRVVHNLVEATLPFDRLSGFLNAIQSIDQLLPIAWDILKEISVWDGGLAGFDEYQWKEERTKAKLMLIDGEWQELILNAEQHPYFNGQVGFMLFLSEVESSGILSADSFDQKLNDRLKLSFRRYSRKAQSVFSRNGVKDSLSVKGEYIWERAVLSLGNYSLKESKNQSFLIGFDRDISWKRFFKLDKQEAAGRKHEQILKSLFDGLEEQDLIGSLHRIREQRIIVSGWRDRFIGNPKLFSYLGGKRYFRRDTPHGFVLFKGERMSGGHAELISYDLHTRLFPWLNSLPFTSKDYYYAGGDNMYDRPCAYFDQWFYQGIHFALDVFGELDGDVLLRFFFRPEGYFPAEVSQAISDLGFELIEKHSNYLLRVSEDVVEEKLKEIFSALNQIV